MVKEKNIGEIFGDIFKEEDETIKRLESILRTKWREYIVVDEKNGTKIKASPAELRDLFVMEIELMALKRRKRGFPKQFWLK